MTETFKDVMINPNTLQCCKDTEKLSYSSYKPLKLYCTLHYIHTELINYIVNLQEFVSDDNKIFLKNVPYSTLQEVIECIDPVLCKYIEIEEIKINKTELRPINNGTLPEDDYIIDQTHVNFYHDIAKEKCNDKEYQKMGLTSVDFSCIPMRYNEKHNKNIIPHYAVTKNGYCLYKAPFKPIKDYLTNHYDKLDDHLKQYVSVIKYDYVHCQKIYPTTELLNMNFKDALMTRDELTKENFFNDFSRIKTINKSINCSYIYNKLTQ